MSNDFNVGDLVSCVIMKPELGDGCFGELVATPPAYAAKVPDGLDIATAGVLGLAGTPPTMHSRPSNQSPVTPC